MYWANAFAKAKRRFSSLLREFAANWGWPLVVDKLSLP